MRQRARTVLDASLSNVVFFGVFRIFGAPAKKDPQKHKNNNKQPTTTSTATITTNQQINKHKSTTQLKINYNQ